MIITEKVLVWLSWKNIHHYENKWYTIPRKKDKKWRINFTKWTKLEVLVKDLMETSKVRVEYKCDDCWKIKSVSYDTLAYRENSEYRRSWNTYCSNCANKRMSWENNAQYKHWNNRYCEYRSNARKRWINFNLSIEDFEELTNWKCHYCWWNSKDRNIKSRWNWIDRKYSDKWYYKENCVSCCATCNFMKRTIPYDEFIIYIKNLYNNIVKNEAKK